MLPHGERGLQQVQQFRVQIKRGPPEACEVKHGKDKRGQLFAVMVLLLVWSKTPFGIWEHPRQPAQPKKRPVSQRRDFAEAMFANKLKDLDTLIRQFQPCAKDDGVAALLEEKKQERDELKIQLQNHKPLHQRLRLATEARAKASKALEVANREEADIVELLALKRAEVDQHNATLLQHNNVELLELRYLTETGQCRSLSFSNHQGSRRWRRFPQVSGLRCFSTASTKGPREQPRLRGRPARTKRLSRRRLMFMRSPPVNVGASAPFPIPRPTRVDPYQTPTPP